MNDVAPTVLVRHASARYQNKILFEDLSWQLIGGKFTCLLGKSGIGKSTLARLIAGLAWHYRDCHVNAVIETAHHQSLAGQVAYLAQSDCLLPWLTVLDNVLIGPTLRGERISQSDRERARFLLAEVELASIENHYPRELSEGMRARAALARTFFENKPIIVMDEPFSKLDAITRFKLQKLTANLSMNRTVLLVTHDIQEAMILGHEIVVMNGQPAKLTVCEGVSASTPHEDFYPYQPLWKHILNLLDEGKSA